MACRLRSCVAAGPREPTVGQSVTGSHRLGWNRLGYGEMTEELRVPCDHLEKLHLLRPSVLKLALC